jgi:protein-L-isoaspartate(D-aspartate) O-methyltransferase
LVKHAHAAEHLLPFLEPGARVLDVGSGSGYLAAVFYHLVCGGDKRGRVVGIEHIPELVDWSVQNLKKDGLGQALEEKDIIIIAGDGRKGHASEGPYDVIHVGAAAPTMPKALVEQLAKPGRMFIPVGTYSQVIIQVDKDSDGKVTQKELMDVRYVPLTDRPSRYQSDL